MRAINLICDGSYKPGIIGLGWLTYNSDGQVKDAKSVRLASKRIKTKHGSQLSELLAAIFAINTQPKECEIKLYTDNQFVANSFNSKSLLMRDLSDIEDHFVQTLEKYPSVHAVNRDEQQDIPRYAFAIAHNASAIASGSVKRECTLPYTGEFWAPEEIVSQERTRSEVRERLRRYGFV
jgi:ribonuclease HI